MFLARRIDAAASRGHRFADGVFADGVAATVTVAERRYYCQRAHALRATAQAAVLQSLWRAPLVVMRLLLSLLQAGRAARFRR